MTAVKTGLIKIKSVIMAELCTFLFEWQINKWWYVCWQRTSIAVPEWDAFYKSTLRGNGSGLN